jgi:hypothetical protein
VPKNWRKYWRFLLKLLLHSLCINMIITLVFAKTKFFRKLAKIAENCPIGPLWLGYILCHFFTNSSGHPGDELPFTACQFLVILACLHFWQCARSCFCERSLGQRKSLSTLSPQNGGQNTSQSLQAYCSSQSLRSIWS